MMNVIDLYALLAYLIVDVLAILSVTGSVVIIIGRVVSSIMGWDFRAPEKIYLWSIGGLIFGLIGFASLALSDQFSNIETTAIFQMRLTTVGQLFALSAAILVISQFLKPRPRRTTFPKSRRMVKQNREA